MAPANPDPVFSRIRAAAARGALSHALLFTGPGDRLAAARFAASAFQCVGPERDRPCGVCPACRKVREDIHPDVITVRDEEHKFIAVDVVREVRKDAYIRPNEGERKVYLFPNCALLTEQDRTSFSSWWRRGRPMPLLSFVRRIRRRCSRPCDPAAWS